MGVLSRDQINKSVDKRIAISGSESFFYALLDNKENQARIARKLRILPGVKQVELLSEKSVSTMTEEIIKNINIDLNSELERLNFSGLKIIFTKDISSRSIDLIRDYLTRLVGGQQLTMGGVKKPIKNQIKISKMLSSIKLWGGSFFILIIFLIWGVSFFQFQSVLLKRSYLIERFQRRTYVDLKVLSSGLAAMSILASGFFFGVFGTPSIVNVLTLAAILCFPFIIKFRSFRWDS